MAEQADDAVPVGQVIAIADAEPVLALLAGETVHVIGELVGAHHELVGRNGLLAGRALTLLAEDAQEVAPAEDLVRVGEQRGAHLAQSAVATGALEAVLVPALVERHQQEALADGLQTSGANVALAAGIGKLGRRLLLVAGHHLVA